jgi:hypothetical protein
MQIMIMGTLALALLSFAPTAAGDDVVPMNCRNFQIPIQIDEKERSKIKELILFYSSDQGGTWHQAAIATPDKSAFAFYAPTDGLYWFNLCVVDAQGRREPPDIYKTAPRQKILVDTLKPNLRIVSVERRGDDIVVSWEVQEDHPDLNTLKLEYRTSDSPAWMWYKASLSPAMSGQAQFRFASTGPVTVRMQVMDQAGNLGSDQKDVAAGAASSTAAMSLIATSAVQSNSAPPLPAPLPPAPASPSFPVSNSMSAAGGTSVVAAPPMPSMSMNSDRSQPVQQVSTTIVPAPERSWSPASGNNNQQPINAGSDPYGRNAAGAFNNAGAASVSSQVPSPGPLAPLQITNNPQLTLDYVVNKVGPSGVGSVELYVTRDDGQTWAHFDDDKDLKPPMTVTLPEEGVYGLRLVVSSRAGLGHRVPRPGDLPLMRVEIDTTPPAAQLLQPQADPHRRDCLILAWNASDKNIAANPVTLQWAEQAEGPWQMIASELTNSGRYTWQLPPNMPYRVYLRLLVRDSAGNVGMDQTAAPVLIDLQEPEIQIKGIITNTAHP